MKTYETQQRKILLEYLGNHKDESVSALNVVEYLAQYGVSKSAVYRNLSDLEKDGKIRRTAKPGERTANYQYVACEQCKGKIHISCIKCGKTAHISGNMADMITEGVKSEDDFIIDKQETVLYGICKDCKE